MKTLTVSTRRFTKQFAALKNRQVRVTDRGRVLGEWVPTPAKVKPVDFAARVAADCAGEKSPFTFAEILQERKKR